jgi:regulator of protease activity HflC (stomatin/prohibitin superfamily)
MGLEETITSIVIDDVLGNLFVSVPPGYIACIYSRGKGVLPKILKPGLHLKIPFWHKAKLFNTQIQEYKIKTGFDVENKKLIGDKEIVALTADDREIMLEGTVLFRLNAQDATKMWENIGDNVVEKIIRPITRSRVRMIISYYSMIDVLSHLGEIEKIIKQELQTPFLEKAIIVENVLIAHLAPKKEEKE